MGMKAKTYGIKILITIGKVYPICFGFHSHLEKYIIK
jgi:hypothetical protein